MSQAFQELLADPLFWGFLVFVGVLIRTVVTRYVKKAVDHRFEARLETHKHNLQLAGEEVRFDLQRRLTGSALYLEKQHAAAAELYSAIRIAHGYVSRLFGLRHGLSLDDCNEDDVREILEHHEVLQGKQQELISAWQRDPHKGAEAVQNHLIELDVPRAEAKLQEARNAIYLHEIYFSDNTIRAIDEFVGVCNEWILRRRNPPQRGQKVKPYSRDELNGALDSVQQALRAELVDPPPLPSREHRRNTSHNTRTDVSGEGT